MSNSAMNAYAKTKFHTASRGDLLLAMYDGALTYAHSAREAIEKGDTSRKGAAVSSLMAVISELNNTLDHSRSPALCENLTRLYSYYLERVQQASAQMDNAPLDEVIGQLKSLRQTWSQAVRIAEQEQGGSGSLSDTVRHSPS